MPLALSLEPKGKRKLGPFYNSREDVVVAGVGDVLEASDLLWYRVL